MNYQELAQAAKNRLENSNWVNRCPDPSKNEECLISAIVFNTNMFLLDTIAFDDLINRLQKLVQMSLVNWNDNEDRTKQDVLDLLDEVIAT